MIHSILFFNLFVRIHLKNLFLPHERLQAKVFDLKNAKKEEVKKLTKGNQHLKRVPGGFLMETLQKMGEKNPERDFNFIQFLRQTFDV